ncbi:Mitochondrial ubiquitin ligase activator of NFKB 1 [Paramuricea clavata]|uniref:RING-type E3 ubiquitin transferase n=1 Tax=Paramuricea clavata TaxID=317549 RepID=A0A7D9EX12_PARCT|nr:Mitochondrial ubiquitin ligase activator of NFKB 1 [Paramuricea clavata]
MDGFALASGVGSLVFAGLCYSVYRNMKDVAIHLKNAESLDVGKDLLEKIKSAPNHTLDYVAIRGDAKALESTLKTENVPLARLLIHRTTVYEHKSEWVRSSKVWHDTKRMISSVVNHVSFSLNSANSSHRVIVDEPLSMSGLEYSRIYNKYDPLNSLSVSTNIVQWASGEKTKGIQTIEDGLLDGTALTAVGKVTLRGGTLKIKHPDTYEYILSKLPLEGIIREKTRSIRRWKYVTIGFTITGGVLLLMWLYRQWRRRSQQVIGGNRFIPPAPPPIFDKGFDQSVSEAGEEQSCVICLTQPRNVVILDCGHICACRACATQVDTCPICRAEIARLVPTYQS